MVKKLKLCNKPVWISHTDLRLVLEYINLNPTWWLEFGVRCKYLNIRLDSRTGHAYITTTHGAISDVGDPVYCVVPDMENEEE